jgi:NAD(P)-dependent dehydrogenase (short-subunit alcohol dehydrogenase family)
MVTPERPLQFDFEGKVVVVTGGSNGIGQATCALFKDLGAEVCIIDEDGSKDAALRDAGYHFRRGDVADEADVAGFFDEIAETYGRLDVLVNNAASFIIKGLDASTQDWQRVLAVNIVGPAMCCKRAVKLFDETAGGAIINVCSVSSVIAQPGFVTYSATKGALLAMTRCLALDLAPRHIRVNAVSPGSIWTDRTEEFVLRNYGIGRKEADVHTDLGGLHVLSRMGDPAEVGKVIVFLASEHASFVTGANYLVDGGYTIV